MADNGRLGVTMTQKIGGAGHGVTGPMTVVNGAKGYLLPGVSRLADRNPDFNQCHVAGGLTVRNCLLGPNASTTRLGVTLAFRADS
jgi:hypothetical protein